jgi:hypothetical protein
VTKLLELLALLPVLLIVAWLLRGLVRTGRAARQAAKRLGGTVVTFTHDGTAVVRCPDTPSTRALRQRCERELGVRVRIV